MRTPNNYAHNQQLSSSASDVVGTVTLGTTAVVRKLSFYNSGSTLRTVTVYVVEASGSAGTVNTLAVKQIPGGRTWNVIEIQGESITVGMKVQASQDAGTDINVNCSGTDVS
jgi:hypothetical protein